MRCVSLVLQEGCCFFPARWEADVSGTWIMEMLQMAAWLSSSSGLATSFPLRGESPASFPFLSLFFPLRANNKILFLLGLVVLFLISQVNIRGHQRQSSAKTKSRSQLCSGHRGLFPHRQLSRDQDHLVEGSVETAACYSLEVGKRIMETTFITSSEFIWYFRACNFCLTEQMHECKEKTSLWILCH